MLDKDTISEQFPHGGPLRQDLKVVATAEYKAALRDGAVVRAGSCCNCGSDDGVMSGHHADYSSPLAVIWLCSGCHMKLHVGERYARHLKGGKRATRGPTYQAATDPWIAMADKGLIPRAMAYHYRNGTGIPGPGRLAMLRSLGYHITIDPPSPAYPKGRAVCERWPGREDQP